MLDAARRALRSPQGRAALVLHLSRLPPPAPRPHHRRVARALLDDEAGRHDGQVHVMGNGDLVLLCRPTGAMQDAAVPALAATLARLFRLDAPDPAALTSVWPLAQSGAALLRYAEARLQDPVPAEAPAPAEPQAGADTLGAVGGLIDGSHLSDLMQRQTAVLLSPGSGPRLRPLFREVAFSMAVLEARAAADPSLLRHLTVRLEERVLDAAAQDLAAAGPMGAGLADTDAALHLNLAVAGVLSEPFARFAAAARVAGVRVGVEITLMEACADLPGFLRARDRLREWGMAVVLDGVSHHALLLTHPGMLQPDLVKLDWSPRMPEAGLAGALAALGAGRVVLHRAESEVAIAWGLAYGVRRFQGRHVDAILAAGRLSACQAAPGCTLRQCVERATATGPGGRSMCANPALLDGGAPLPVQAASSRAAPAAHLHAAPAASLRAFPGYAA